MATLSENDRCWLTLHTKEPLSEMEIALIEARFDTETDIDEATIELALKNKELKKVKKKKT